MQHLPGLQRGLWLFRAGKERNKVDRCALDCQEKAYWLVHRCPVSALLAHPPPLTPARPTILPTPVRLICLGLELNLQELSVGSRPGSSGWKRKWTDWMESARRPSVGVRMERSSLTEGPE